MDELISVSLTEKHWNVLEVALDRFIEEQSDDGSDESKDYADRGKLVKILMQMKLEA